MHRPFVALLAFPLLLAGGARAKTPAWKNTAELCFQVAGLSGATAIGPLMKNDLKGVVAGMAFRGRWRLLEA